MVYPPITCPKCGAAFALTDAVAGQVQAQFAADFERRRNELHEALKKREDQLAADRAALDRRAAEVQSEVARQLQLQRDQLVSSAARAAEEKVSVELRDLQAQLVEQRQRVRQAEANELALRSQRAALEAERDRQQLEVARTLTEERQKIADAARAQAIEAERLKLADKEAVIRGLQEQIAALQQRAGQGSIQLLGETLELTLEADLRAAFRFDEIAEIKKGHRGADVIQHVRASNGAACGSILWEAKRARTWSADWPEKLKSDQREIGADLAVMVVTCPVEGIRGFGLRDGIWVCEPALAAPVAAALRQGLIGAAAQRVQQADRAGKEQLLYDYLCGVGFRQHIEALVEVYVALAEQLQAEQRAFARQWKEREQKLNQAVTRAAMLYGSVQGIVGRETLPEIKSLALPAAVAPTP